MTIIAIGCGPQEPQVAAPDDPPSWIHRIAQMSNVPYGSDPAQVLDLYVQGSYVGRPDYFEVSKEPKPTVLFIHGGAWLRGDKAGSEAFNGSDGGLAFFLSYVERGYNVVNINYRLGPGTAPQAVDDAMCALKWVVDSADEYGFDKTKIILSGGSAGGHLALTAAMLGSRPGHHCYPGGEFGVAAVVNWFGISDIEMLESYLAQDTVVSNYALAWIGAPEDVPLISEAYSPVALVDEDSPPVISLHGDADIIVPHAQSVALHEELDRLRVPNELVTLEGGVHVGFDELHFQHAFRRVFSFLDQHVR